MKGKPRLPHTKHTHISIFKISQVEIGDAEPEEADRGSQLVSSSHIAPLLKQLRDIL